MRQVAAVVAFALITAACSSSGGDDTTTTAGAGVSTTEAPTTTTTSATTPPPSTTTTVALDGPTFALVGITMGAVSPMVVIRNISDATVDLAGHWLCQQPATAPLPALQVGAGRSVAISLGGDTFRPPPDAIALGDPVDLGTINPVRGEIGLFTGNRFDDSSTVVSYVEWGNNNHPCSAAAIEAEIWQDDEWLETNANTIGVVALEAPAFERERWLVLTGIPENQPSTTTTSLCNNES